MSLTLCDIHEEERICFFLSVESPSISCIQLTVKSLELRVTYLFWSATECRMRKVRNTPATSVYRHSLPHDEQATLANIYWRHWYRPKMFPDCLSCVKADCLAFSAAQLYLSTCPGDEFWLASLHLSHFTNLLRTCTWKDWQASQNTGMTNKISIKGRSSGRKDIQQSRMVHHMCITDCCNYVIDESHEGQPWRSHAEFSESIGMCGIALCCREHKIREAFGNHNLVTSLSFV